MDKCVLRSRQKIVLSELEIHKGPEGIRETESIDYDYSLGCQWAEVLFAKRIGKDRWEFQFGTNEVYAIHGISKQRCLKVLAYSGWRPRRHALTKNTDLHVIHVGQHIK